MDYKQATHQQLMIIRWDDIAATKIEQVQAQAELWRRTHPQWEWEQYKAKAVYS